MTLAMAQHQLKRFEEARATQQQGIQFADEHFPKITNQSAPEDRGNDWIIANALMREAKALIQSDSKNGAVNGKPL